MNANGKPAGWFSRRHPTDKEHRVAQEKWAARRHEKMARAKAQSEATAENRARRGKGA